MIHPADAATTAMATARQQSPLPEGLSTAPVGRALYRTKQATSCDNGQMYEPIMEMIGSLSQQMVEFDSQRKEFDMEVGKQLASAVSEMHQAVMDSTRKIAETVKFVEMHAKYDNANGEKRMSALQQSHSDLHTKHEQSEQSLQGLLGALQQSQQSQKDLHAKHDKCNQGLQGLNSKQDSFNLSWHKNMQSLTQNLDREYGELHRNVTALSNAVETIPVMDPEPLHRHMHSASEWMQDHGSRIRTMEQRMQGLEQGVEEANGVLSVMLTTLQDISGRSLHMIHEDVRATKGAVLQEARDSRTSILREIHALDDHTKAFEGKFCKHSSNLMEALSVLPDHNEVLDALAAIFQEQTDHISRKHVETCTALNDLARDVNKVVTGLQTEVEQAEAVHKVSTIIGAVKSKRASSPIRATVFSPQSPASQTWTQSDTVSPRTPAPREVCGGVRGTCLEPQTLLSVAHVPGAADMGGDDLSPIKTSRAEVAQAAQLQFDSSSKQQSRQRLWQPREQEEEEEQEEERPEGFRCLCSFTAGTEAALQRHISRFKGDAGHGAI